MKRTTNWQAEEIISWIPAVFIVLAIAAGLYFWLKSDEPQTPETPPVAEQALPEQDGPPKIQYPVPVAPVETAPAEIPSVEQFEQVEETPVEPEAEPESAPEPTIEEQVTFLFDWREYGQLFLLEALINHFVVTIDNMTGPKLPQKFTFTRPPPGKFMVVKETEDEIYLDPKNHERYTKFVEFAMAADINRFVTFYVRHYPKFQSAYEELGYPDRYFNDRFVEVIDHVLAAPDVEGPFRLEQPKVYYTFADPKLEALSAGQKIMIRIGPDNAAKVKRKLLELRRALTNLGRE
jgi:hypothetical protein